jgi:REP element-mobilizing transposase RayT
MSCMSVRLYGLLTWTTFRRLPLIHQKVAAFLRRILSEIARRHDARVMAIGIVRNHVHLVLELSSRPDLPRLVQGLKGASARIANRDGYMPRAPLRWASGYDFRSVSVNDLQRAIMYVRNQDRRHPELAIENPG